MNMLINSAIGLYNKVINYLIKAIAINVNLFIKYSDAWSAVNSFSTCDNFVKGFKMGTKIALEALDYK